ncbi:hypothetical protein [Pedobacter soli]|uniref:Uncharacterized protein n=1 Tax=Pedobacter soli TaxID=390242 RepID=A0A1G6PMN1_9SPHI|nr:hypothetical protein [Pedobacter soli]SDC80637.1 hypothetical protein SAMN04488024_10378 [Pedobacter soli]
MLTFILQATKADNFKDGIYLGIAVAAAIALFILSKKFSRKG